RNIAKCAVNVVLELIKAIGPPVCQAIKPLTDRIFCTYFYGIATPLSLATLLIEQAPDFALNYATSIPELVLSRARGEDPKYALETARTIRAMTKSIHTNWYLIAYDMFDNLVEIIDRKGSRADEENTTITEIAILSLVYILYA
ncbi:hypothetical protein PMAYCL1PPCAC_21109, partial [Pristionchus mayeri]